MIASMATCRCPRRPGVTPAEAPGAAGRACSSRTASRCRCTPTGAGVGPDLGPDLQRHQRHRPAGRGGVPRVGAATPVNLFVASPYTGMTTTRPDRLPRRPALAGCAAPALAQRSPVPESRARPSSERRPSDSDRIAERERLEHAAGPVAGDAPVPAGRGRNHPARPVAAEQARVHVGLPGAGRLHRAASRKSPATPAFYFGTYQLPRAHQPEDRLSR
jgi:hypothetical protein